jgi:hypothetical protein
VGLGYSADSRALLVWLGVETHGRRPWIRVVHLLRLPVVCCICCDARMGNVLQVGGGGLGAVALGGGRV